MQEKSTGTVEHWFELDRLSRYFSEHSTVPHVALEGPHHVVRYVNPAFTRLVDRTASQILGHRFSQVVPEGAANGGMALFDRVYRTATPHNLFDQAHGDGLPIYWSYAAWPIFGDEGLAIGVMVQITDVTQAALFQKQIRDMNQALVLGSVRQHKLTQTADNLNASLNGLNSSLEDRIADRTADLRQRAQQLRLLNVELAHTEQRERKQLAEMLHDGMQQLLVAAKMRLAVLRRRVGSDGQDDVNQLNDLLTQSITASRTLAVELFPPALHHGGLIPGLHWLGKEMAEKQNLAVEVRADDEAEPAAEGLRLILFQSVRELLFNVIKHSGVNRAVVTLERDKAGDVGGSGNSGGSGGGSALLLHVSDLGKGIADDGPDTVAPPDPSAGFGMSSVRHRVESQGGTVIVHSVPHQGTRVTLSIPDTRFVTEPVESP